MNHKIRLGPIAVFLTVIAAVLATLAVLTAATSRADAVMAERFAKVTGIRYALEAEGNRFLQAVDARGAAAAEDLDGLPEGTEKLPNGNLTYYTEKEGYALTVEVSLDAETGKSEIAAWKISKIWEGADPFEDIWPGM